MRLAAGLRPDPLWSSFSLSDRYEGKGGRKGEESVEKSEEGE